MPPRLDPSAYTVGWVCAIKDEVTASRAFLDEEHEQPSRQPNDDNVYVLGRVGNHNVAIVSPGVCSYGIDVIAHTVAHLVRTFQNIRFGLMVGIGGAAPSVPDPKNPLNDIRLGDVVVSEPKGNHGKAPYIVLSWPCVVLIRHWLHFLTRLKEVYCNTTKADGKKKDHLRFDLISIGLIHIYYPL